MRALFIESPVAIGFSRDGVMLDANPAYVALFGYLSADELIGTSLLAQIAPSQRAEVLGRIEARARGEPTAERYRTLGLRKNGQVFPFEVTTTRVLVNDGPLTLAFLTDISDQEAAEKALKASEERFRTLSAAATEGVFTHTEGKIELANEAVCAMYGYTAEELAGVDVRQLTAPESLALAAEALRTAPHQPYEGVAKRKDGSTFPVELQGRTLLLQGRPFRVVIVHDLTERKKAEAERRALDARVQQAQKVESLGMLAGGVAHDFNNILTIVSNGVTIARRDPGLSPTIATQLDNIALATERAADLCRQMLAYAGRTRLERSEVALDALVEEMANMLEASVKAKADLSRQLPKVPTMLGDPTQLRQVVLNLVLNAAEAISGRRGTIRLSAGAEDLAALPRTVAGAELKPGPHVWLEVRDDGIGMEPKTVSQMFEPFFTTKLVGRGLGMAAVLGIVRSHQGALEVESQPGAGTRIRVWFPATPLRR
ncbi:MAG: PAS domain S-box protein [Myxococcaceae bacterium]